ncbi:MAG TPA: rhomboid family intramembrane serine protease [Candidatus Kapabacteria bacterium]|nr:rhomboid family intramembrane serine protease [Candidatus Kapabacteria bacterium]
MANFNRSYTGRSFLGGFMAGAPVIKAMVVANVGIYLFEIFFGGLRLAGIPIEKYIQYYFYLYPLQSGNFYFWQPVTYMFLHGGFGHIFFNMFALIIFGPALEAAWGSRKTFIYYMLCGLGGGFAHLIISPMLGGGGGPLLGASGAIFGFLVAFGLIFPDQPIYLYFLIPIKAKYAVLGFILIEVMSIPASDGVGHLAHLGGAVVGIIYILIDGGGRGFFKRGVSTAANRWQNTGTQTKSRRFIQDDDATFDADFEEVASTKTMRGSNTTATMGRVITQEDIDRILDKIAASGYQNLTAEERDILFEASRKMDQRK